MSLHRTVNLKEPLSDEQTKLLASIDHEKRVMAAINQPFGDVEQMDRRRLRDTLEIAQDIARIRIAGLWARLEETAHD